eukprot:GCRY01001104.1.p1 GENE.GCRY01001104.1~~GCRY01001104.1.p1  ORF type:complete len:330 (-),score=33.53 GCRY01001104.1:754-1743(-)
MKLLIVAAVLIIGFGFCLADKGSPPVPVVLVTSLTGATLECKLEHAHPPHVYCSKNKDWFTIWYEDSMFIPGFDECFFHDFAPIFNENTRTFENAPGVQIRPKGFGDIVEAESIKKGKKDMLPLYKSFVGNLTEHLGYVRNVDIKAAQYDWRLAPPQLSEYFSQLKEMVEQMYIDRGNRPVLLIAHSYGNNIAHAFLRNMPQEWKDKYVDSYVAVAPPHQGSFDALITMLVEFEFHSLPLNAKIMRSLIRSLPAIYYLLPNPESYDADFPVVELGNTNYTASQFADLFSAVGLGASKDIYNLFKNESCNIEDPGVIFCKLILFSLVCIL